MAKYEAHLTAHINFADKVEDVVKCGNGYKFSKIDGDALLGDKPYCYVTAYDAEAATLKRRMEACRDVLAAVGVPTLRIKIERIIYDTKTAVDEIEA